MFDRSRLPPLDAALLARTAEMLAMPERIWRPRNTSPCGGFRDSILLA